MPSKLHDSSHISWKSLQSRALDSGAWVNSSISIFWDISGKCERPVKRTLKGVPAPSFAIDTLTSYSTSRYIDINVPCRKCPKCLSYRGWLWRTRAQSEMVRSSRTWMTSYTVRPDARVYFKIKAKSDDFKDIAAEIGKEWTKYIKRVRKEAYKKNGARLRYLLVFEAHKDGFPHVHALIHERGAEVSKRTLQKQWPFGFSGAKLADEKAPFYLTKYLVKSMLARVRASEDYGQRPMP